MNHAGLLPLRACATQRSLITIISRSTSFFFWCLFFFFFFLVSFVVEELCGVASLTRWHLPSLPSPSPRATVMPVSAHHGEGGYDSNNEAQTRASACDRVKRERQREKCSRQVYAHPHTHTHARRTQYRSRSNRSSSALICPVCFSFSSKIEMCLHESSR